MSQLWGMWKTPSVAVHYGLMAKFVCFHPSLIQASRSAWCGAPLEMTEGTIWIWGTEGLSIRPRRSNPNDDSNSNSITLFWNISHSKKNSPRYYHKITDIVFK
jgi:hypothetical protein